MRMRRAILGGMILALLRIAGAGAAGGVAPGYSGGTGYGCTFAGFG